ncbi:MAG: hypothetical protein AB3N28_07920 [Kordiimonas sp.]
MRLKIATATFMLLAGLAWYFEKSSQPIMIVKVEILALEDVPNTLGLRRIQVRLPDDEVVWVETLAPFFYRVGYQARLAVYEPVLRERYYKFIAD